ncbi:unnamed protein product, partial [Staurois parvus]
MIGKVPIKRGDRDLSVSIGQVCWEHAGRALSAHMFSLLHTNVRESARHLGPDAGEATHLCVVSVKRLR